MKTALKDPLLLFAKAVAIFLQGVMALGGAIRTLVVFAALFGRGRILAEISGKIGEAAPAGFYPALIGILLVGLAIVALLFFFFDKLRRIIGTVGEGDPFQPENARRLNIMAWLMLAVQLLFIPATALGMILAQVADEMDNVDISSDGSVDISGILLVVILFILARVFRKGTEMREELEGTV